MIFFVCLLMMFFVSVKSESAPMIVRELDLSNSRLTRDWVILRELPFQVGDTITEMDLIRAQVHLENLDIFHEVRVTADSTGKVRVDLVESWPLIPLMGAEFTEGSASEAFTSLRTFFKTTTIYTGLQHYNFMGSAGNLYAFLQSGAAQGFSAGYKTRWLSPHLPIAFKGEFQTLRLVDRHWAVQDSTLYVRNIGGLIDIATHAGAPSRIGIAVQYREVRIEDSRIKLHSSTRHVVFSPYFILDHRDREWYPRAGSFATSGVDLATGSSFFVRSRYDLRGYFPLNASTRPWIIAVCGRAGTVSQKSPSWSHFYSGFDSGFRGYRNVQSEANSFVSGEAELRFPFSREGTYNVPFLGRYGKRWPWGVYGVVFVQRAQQTNAGHISDFFGGGAGLHFRAPWVQILETAVALNREGNVEFSLTAGINF